ncbi:centrosomal protein 43 L homeolog isoform X1 [Xenopus laevis]|uniref:Centrosomal protein 43 n=1 Tax=Xenopus laevis TaxID=8355 RepID=A0A8J0V8S9_XENLA|nr:centrosomal protein 43 L homeolog isoform X1 [Xenopus laevis]XP_018117611.1 centrosomal protein 43 L homeolog isoform X1 [Xenopus laevis]XP_018117612.1 centrosomal protein 43 L homeolog isoform X1 [Xenopus laevis]XP_041418262.1 centrosomal protein 43 L homeolog isoform X1 [Xenopus laevis]
MSATEEDTELRDLLIQTLENNGILNKIKAELRASVFLALEEQEKTQNKTPLVNESLKKFLNTRDGRLVANLFTEFLQFFNLDFTLAVFQPEASLENAYDDRNHLAKDLGIVDSESVKSGPLVLELVRRCHQKDKIISGGESDKPVSVPKELSPKQLSEAQKKFDLYDKDKNGEISKDELRTLFLDLFPHFHRSMLERYVSDEFKAADKYFNNGINFHEFIGMYKRLFIHCRSVVTHDIPDIIHSPRRSLEAKASSQVNNNQQTDDHIEKNTLLSRESKQKHENHLTFDTKPDFNLNKISFDNEERKTELEEDYLEGDSFFDDPIPKPEKMYGCAEGADVSLKTGVRSNSMERKNEPPKHDGSVPALASLPPLKMETGSRFGAFNTKESDKTGDEDDDYIDDFNSTSQRSDKSDVSIGEEIEEEELSVDDFVTSEKLEDLTLDHTISQTSDVADYLEDVS